MSMPKLKIKLVTNLISGEESAILLANGVIDGYNIIKHGEGNLMGGSISEFVGIAPVDGGLYLQDICSHASAGVCTCSLVCENRGKVAVIA